MRGSGRNEGEWIRKVETGTRKKFLTVGEACVAIFRPISDFNGSAFISSGFSTEQTLISASAVSHYRRQEEQR